ncbi:di-trans,poly-cis-decaprenylcistransferase [Marinihelvus fidelis]|uniref:Ditrans,polycis-undecaprenyl-diphosphate synthase ((2E,6E)-farnesyl-diphosphate specific) n=1 Tax=Marinihelvus fidelis TaxID=2613842 RepID=A0A5N0T482_9GAMM|nr:polyprenyl diphosphate synthase [Marinihelvus fidelis]KAA9129608.1 di-trans,poly-cis-decaprenylcistransferase [Marinihelvus fidelis]
MPEAHMPEHVAIVMDGNGRWAEQRRRSRSWGHQAGLKALRRTARHGTEIGIRILTVFAFSSENWNRPALEVSRLMDLFMSALEKEVKGLHENGVKVRFIGDLSGFKPELRERMLAAQELTAANTRSQLNVAANYGGRWDIVNAARTMAEQARDGQLDPASIDEGLFGSRLALADTPDPDLFIRTGGEMRISNFLLWQCAYTEFYFSDVLWPDFGKDELDRAIAAYQQRERRFGKTGKQVRDHAHA